MRVLLLLNTSKSRIVATMARTQAVGGAHSALAGPIIACPAGKGRRFGQVPRVRNVIAASEAATRTTFVAFETDAPMRLVIGRKGATVTNFFAILTPEAKVVLGGIIKVPMACGAWPLPLASLRESVGPCARDQETAISSGRGRGSIAARAQCRPAVRGDEPRRSWQRRRETQYWRSSSFRWNIHSSIEATQLNSLSWVDVSAGAYWRLRPGRIVSGPQDAAVEGRSAEARALRTQCGDGTFQARVLGGYGGPAMADPRERLGWRRYGPGRAQAERTVLEFGPGGSQGLPFDQLHGQIIRWFPEALGPLELPHRLEIYALG